MMCKKTQYQDFRVYLIIILLICLGSKTISKSNAQMVQRSFTVDSKNGTFLKDGKPFQYISGSLHYFRIPRAYWFDRLSKAKAAGLDAVQIYIAWNLHQPEEGVFQFDDEKDVEYFLELISKLDLLAIVRVGPYMCAEWDFGGLPAWLLRINENMKIRTASADYYNYVYQWFSVLFLRMERFLYSNGGPIIMIQLENEYGSTGICDQKYMSSMYDLARFHLGPDIILFTVDGNSVHLLRCGCPDSRYLATVDFGPTGLPPNVSFQPIELFQKNSPLVNSEFYSGWFDAWGSEHSRKSSDLMAKSLMELMRYSQRVSVNIYMFHGGTNFGLWNGKPSEIPVITSYDYDAPISEAGDITEKYLAIQKVIFQFKGLTPPTVPKNISKFAYPPIQLIQARHILDHLNEGYSVSSPVTMEKLHQYQGFMAYCAELPSWNRPEIFELILERFADLVHVFTTDRESQDKLWHRTLYASENQPIFLLGKLLENHTRIVLLLENTGHVNYGRGMEHDVKGILGKVTLNGAILRPWHVYPIRDIFGSLNSVQYLRDSRKTIPGTIFTGNLLLGQNGSVGDTFVEPTQFTRGILSVNDKILGRFDQQLGPQLRLYIPRVFLHPGINQFKLIELSPNSTFRKISGTLNFYEEPRWSR